MAGLSGLLVAKVTDMLRAPSDGVNARLSAIQRHSSDSLLCPIREISALNATVETYEKGGLAKYPSLNVYCEKLSNSMREKFRVFSGKASMVVEVRHSQDHLDRIEPRLHLYVDAVCALLDDSRGDWSNGAFYTGGYEVTFEAVTRGGKNFLQRAKVKFEVEVSR